MEKQNNENPINNDYDSFVEIDYRKSILDYRRQVDLVLPLLKFYNLKISFTALDILQTADIRETT